MGSSSPSSVPVHDEVNEHAVQDRRRVVALVITIVAIELVSGFTQGFYEPLIPQFGVLLDIGASHLTLFNAIPTAVAALSVPFLTRLGDIFGYRRILRIVISVVFAATVVIALGVLVRSWPLVLVGRALNGPIAVWLPLHIALVHAKTAGTDATRGVSIIVATLTVGTVLGTASSGFLFSFLGSLAATVALIPVGTGIALFLVLFVMPEFVAGIDRHIDGWGFVGLAVIMLLAILGFVTVVTGGMSSLIGALLLVAAGVLSWLWVRFEHRQTHPALNTRILFSARLGPIYLASIAYGAVLYGYLSPLGTYLAADPQELGYGYGYVASQISIVQTAILLLSVVSALLLPVVVKYTGERNILILGFGAATLAFVVWTIIPSGLASLIVFVILNGLGFGIIGAAIPVTIPDRAPVGTHGIATGLFNSAQTLGGALGSGLFLSLLAIGQHGAKQPSLLGYRSLWLVASVILIIGVSVLLALLSKDTRKETQ